MTRTSRLLRTGWLGVVVAVIGLHASPAAAQQPVYTWNNPAGGNWSDSLNWLGGSPPMFGEGAILVFGDPTPFSGGYTATNDLGSLSFNRLVFSSNATPASGTPIIVTGDAANQLILETFTPPTGSPVLPQIVQGGTGTAVITANVVFNNNTTITGDGRGILAFGTLTGTLTGATLSGSGQLIINRPNLNPFGTANFTVLNPANADSFDGGVTLTAGNLVLAGPRPLGTGQFTIGTGPSTVHFAGSAATAVTINNTVQLNGTMILTGANGGTFAGPINGDGGILVSPVGLFPTAGFASTFTFQGTNTFTGALTVRPVGSPFSTAALFNQSGSAQSSSYTAHLAGSIVLDNVTTNLNDRLNTAATLTLHGGGFQLRGNSTTASSQTLATLVTTGQAEFTVTGGGSTSAGRNATLTFGSWDRQQNSVAQFVAPGLASTGQNAARIIFTTNPGGAVGGGGAPGTTTQSILPYAVASVGPTGSSIQHELVRYNATNGQITPLFDTDTTFPTPPPIEYAKNFHVLSGTTSFANVKIIDAVGGINAPTSINSLVLRSASVGGAGTLTVSGGVILTTNTSGQGNPSPVPATIGFNTLAFGNQTGYVHTYIDTAITSPITGTGGLVKAGPAGLMILGPNNVSGGLTVNGGFVIVNDQSALGTGNITLAGGVITFAEIPTLTNGTQSTFTLNRNVTLGTAGGALQAFGTDATLTASGQLTGPGSLNISFGGLVRVTNTANDYTGGTVIGQGTLAISNPAVLGHAQGTISMIFGSTLQADAPFQTSRMFLLQGNPAIGPQTIFTNGHDVSIHGIITSSLGSGTVTNTFNPTGQLLKAGTGTLTLSAINTYTGPTVIGDQNPTVRVGNPAAAQTGGTILLAGPNGGIPLSSAIMINPGSNLFLDYSAPPDPNFNRVGSVPVTIRGGQLALLGIAGVNATESLGNLTVAGGVGTILLAQPGNGSVVLSVGGLAVDAANPGVAVIRGDNLGQTGARFTRLQFSGTGPALVNGIIPFAVAQGINPSSQPTDFVTTATNASGFVEARLFTGYGSLAAPGATVTAHQAGSTFGLTGATSLNALRLGAGGGVNLNGNTLTIGGASQAGAILAVGGANTGITNGTLAFGTRTASITTVNDLTIGANLTGTAGLAKAGPGVLSLSGTGTLTGPVVVGEGTLRYGSHNALPATAALTVNAGAVVDFGNFTLNTPTVASINGFGGVQVNGFLVVNGSASSVIGGPLTGGINGNITKQGTGTLTLAGNNSGYTGRFTVQNGLLRVDTPTALGTGIFPVSLGSTTASGGLAIGPFVSTFDRAIELVQTTPTTPAIINTVSAGHVTISSNIHLTDVIGGTPSTLRLVGNNSSLTTTFNDPTPNLTGVISGTGRLEVATGFFRISGNNTYSGGTTFISGSTSLVGIGHDNAFGTGTININTTGSSSSVDVYLRADGGARTVANPIVYNANFNTMIVTGTNDLTLSGPINLGGQARSFHITNTGLTTFSGVLSNGGLSKSGVGTLVLTNSGSTGISGLTAGGGVLVVNPSITTPVTVTNGGTFVSAATFTSISINNRGTVSPGSDPLAPGNGVGVLTTTGAFQSDTITFGTLVLDLNGPTPGTGHDQLVVASAGGASTIRLGNNAGTDGLTLRLRLGFAPTDGSSITIIDNQGTASITGRFAGLPQGTTFSIGEFGGIEYRATITYIGGTGNDVVLQNIQPVPEPGSVLLVAAVAAGLVVFARRLGRGDGPEACPTLTP
jgi:autotransporter-associated beta strand protein